MKLKELKVTDFQEGEKYDFLFPIGATEQHGPFLPFGTDTYITDYITEKVAEEFPQIIILPTLEVSRSQEHRGFYGTLRLSEETLERVMFDMCNSLKERARTIFIYSFHANGVYIERFIQKYTFPKVKIICLNESTDEDCNYIENNILHGPLDGHAGNSEISNILVIDEKLVKIPSKEYPKSHIENHFETDNLIEKCPNGIADNHPEWIINKEVGQQILDIYVERIIENIRTHSHDSLVDTTIKDKIGEVKGLRRSNIILLNGACGIGKSTIAKLLHESIEGSFLREKDHQRRNISHYKDTPDHQKKSGGMILEATKYMIDFCIKSNIDFIFDGVVVDDLYVKELQNYIQERGGYFLHIYLNAPKKVRSERLRNRGISGSLTYEKAEFFYDTLNTISQKIDMTEIDTMKYTPEEICTTIKNMIQ